MSLKYQLVPTLLTSLATSIGTTTGANINVSDNLQSKANIRTFQYFEGKYFITTVTIPIPGNRNGMVLQMRLTVIMSSLFYIIAVIIYAQFTRT